MKKGLYAEEKNFPLGATFKNTEMKFLLERVMGSHFRPQDFQEIHTCQFLYCFYTINIAMSQDKIYNFKGIYKYKFPQKSAYFTLFFTLSQLLPISHSEAHCEMCKDIPNWDTSLTW